MLRGQLFIKKEFQWKIILIILLSVFIFANITISLMLMYISYMFENESLSVLLTEGNIYYKLLPALAVIELIGIAFIFYLSLYTSHIMAGPIYRLEKLVAMMGDGDFSFEVRTRKNDEFKELTSRLDSMSKKIKAKIYNIKTASESIKGSFQNIIPALNDNNLLQSHHSIQDIESMIFLINELESQLNDFKLEASAAPEPAAINRTPETDIIPEITQK